MLSKGWFASNKEKTRKKNYSQIRSNQIVNQMFSGCVYVFVVVCITNSQRWQLYSGLPAVLSPSGLGKADRLDVRMADSPCTRMQETLLGFGEAGHATGLGVEGQIALHIVCLLSLAWICYDSEELLWRSNRPNRLKKWRKPQSSWMKLQNFNTLNDRSHFKTCHHHDSVLKQKQQ